MSERTDRLVAGCVTMLGIVIVGTMARVVGMVLLWQWFVVPLGAPPITATHAYGIECLRHLLWPAPVPTAEERERADARLRTRGIEWAPMLSTTFLAPGIAVGCGWLAHLWMRVAVTLRKRIADGLRKVAVETAEKATAANRRAVESEDRAMSGRAIRVMAAATVFIDIADWIDPGSPHVDRDASTGGPYRGDGRAESRPAPAAPLDGAGREWLRGAAMPAGEHAAGWSSHDVDGTTGRMRMVRGGRA